MAPPIGRLFLALTQPDGPTQLRTFRYFQEFAHCASLRKAPEQPHVAPTAINRQIEQLEHHFGAPLLERGPRGIRLTAEGEFVAERIGTVLREIGEVKTMISERRNLETGSVSVYASEEIVSGLLTPVLADFTRRSRIRFDIAVASARHTLDTLCQGRANLDVGFCPPHRAGVEKFETVDVWQRALVSSTHPTQSAA
ncbi:LysR family transcriptional regulator [Burkholderia sp. BDU5]|uniref:LysR family transcriptional regulator n=1 Tax=Burkholderia sp. BDU5 TaxID=1385590 RepID=UPI000A6EA8A5|nr:LysR family transcriptional regulator [Burkholderia sp. BDU5]